MPCLPTHTYGGGADDYQAEQNDPARKTVREQLVEALATLIDIRENPLHYPLDIMVPAYAAAWVALDRARAEPEEHCGCNDGDCPTWAHGFDAGCEAQREPPGGGTA